MQSVLYLKKKVLVGII